MDTTLTVPDALVAAMVTTAAADDRMPTVELLTMTRIIETLPAFSQYDVDRVTNVSNLVYDLLEAEDGLDAIIGLIREALPPGFNETAYALACDVAAADRSVPMAELRWLELLRDGLSVGRLAAAAIERAARARYLTLPHEAA
jgi:tellurite resistance protein